MMGIEVPETCWAYHKCNKVHTVTSSWFLFSAHKLILLENTLEACANSCRPSRTPTLYQHITTRLCCYRIHQGPAQVHAAAQGHSLLHIYLYIALEDGLLFLLFAPYTVPKGRECP